MMYYNVPHFRHKVLVWTLHVVLLCSLVPSVSLAQQPTATISEADMIETIQRFLQQLGYDPGPIDGIMGKKTAAAIRAFQRDHNLRVDGEASESLIEALKQAKRRYKQEKEQPTAQPDLTTEVNTREGIIYPPKVVDSAGILKKSTVRTIEGTSMFPRDIPVLVRSVKVLPMEKIGVIANQMMENEEYWSKVRPKGWLSKIRGDYPSAKGVYILLSKSPRLIQIRYGNGIRLEAYRTGLTAGEHYLQIQEKYSLGQTDAALLEAIEWISTTLPEALDLPWYLRGLKSINANTEEVSELSLPSDGLYANWLFKPYIKITTLGFKVAKNSWITLLTNAIIYWILRVIVIGIIISFVLKIFTPEVRKILTVIISTIFGIIFTFPAIGSILILSQGRAEDQLALLNFGITLPQYTRFPPEFFSIKTGLSLAAIAVATRLLSRIAASPENYFLARLPHEWQVKLFKSRYEDDAIFAIYSEMVITSEFSDQKTMETKPFVGFAQYDFGNEVKSAAKWFVLLLFMPNAISLYAFAIFALSLPFYIINVIFVKKRVEKLFNRYYRK